MSPTHTKTIASFLYFTWTRTFCIQTFSSACEFFYQLWEAVLEPQSTDTTNIDLHLCDGSKWNAQLQLTQIARLLSSHQETYKSGWVSDILEQPQVVWNVWFEAAFGISETHSVLTQILVSLKQCCLPHSKTILVQSRVHTGFLRTHLVSSHQQKKNLHVRHFGSSWPHRSNALSSSCRLRSFIVHFLA